LTQYFAEKSNKFLFKDYALLSKKSMILANRNLGILILPEKINRLSAD